MIWVLLFLAYGDSRLPQVIHTYDTQQQCEDVLDSIVRKGMADENELVCLKMPKAEVP